MCMQLSKWCNYMEFISHINHYKPIDKWEYSIYKWEYNLSHLLSEMHPQAPAGSISHDCEVYGLNNAVGSASPERAMQVVWGPACE